MKTKVRFGGNPFRPLRRLNNLAAAAAIEAFGIETDPDSDGSISEQPDPERLTLPELHQTYDRAFEPELPVRYSLAEKRAFYRELGFEGPIVSRDWDGRLAANPEFNANIPGAKSEGAIVAFEQFAVWENGEILNLPSDFFSFGVWISIAYTNNSRTKPLGLIARDQRGALLFISGKATGWNAGTALAYLRYRLEVSGKGPQFEQHLNPVKPAVIAGHPQLIEALRRCYLNPDRNGVMLSPEPVESGAIMLHRCIWFGKLGYCARKDQLHWFTETDSAEAAAESAEYNWALNALHPHWSSGSGYEIISALVGEKPFEGWRAIVPLLEGSRAEGNGTDNRFFFPGTFARIGEATVTVGFYFIRGEPELFDQFPDCPEYGPAAQFTLVIKQGETTRNPPICQADAFAVLLGDRERLERLAALPQPA